MKKVQYILAEKYTIPRVCLFYFIFSPADEITSACLTNLSVKVQAVFSSIQIIFLVFSAFHK